MSWEFAHDNKDCIGKRLDWRSSRRRHWDGECSILPTAAVRLRLWRANLERLPAGAYGCRAALVHRIGAPLAADGVAGTAVGNCAPYQGPVGGPPRRWYGY
jgi:hypothetical protein